jgi:hypothetical protein
MGGILPVPKDPISAPKSTSHSARNIVEGKHYSTTRCSIIEEFQTAIRFTASTLRKAHPGSLVSAAAGAERFDSQDYTVQSRAIEAT